MRLVLGLLLACGSAPPETDPLDMLRVGVDPRVEADEVAGHLLEAGFEQRRRIDGQSFSAVAFRHPESGKELVRVVSTRGLVMALEAPSATHNRDRIDLVSTEAQDLDGDGREELVVSAHDAVFDRVCLAIVRVEEDGGLREVTPDLSELGGDGCVERVEPFGAAYAARAVLRFVELSHGEVPRVELVFRGQDWSEATPSEVWDEQRRQRLGRLNTVPLAQRYRIAVELALIARFQGADADAQRQAFEAPLQGQQWPLEYQQMFEMVRAVIARQWRAECEPEC